jgi:hypothetical protein
MTWKKQYLARKTPSDNFLSDILDRYSLKRYEEKFGSIDTAVTSGFSWPYSINWIDNLVGFEHYNQKNKLINIISHKEKCLLSSTF